MAEEKEGKKKGGKLPIILALVVVLGGGGFFMMNKGGDEDAAAPVFLELGEQHDVGEFLLNLNDGRTFADVAITVQVNANTPIDYFDKYLPAFRDATINVFSAHSHADVSSVEGKKKLRRALATAYNEAMAKKDESSQKRLPADQVPPANSDEILYEEFDSDTGPVLKIYFTKFATQ